jgi:hypothetical protein
LTVRDKYQGHDNVNTASGQGMKISHVGHSLVRTPTQNFHLRNILHVPHASKNLLSVHRFTYNNGLFIEFHPFFFLIKDQVTRRIIHRGWCVEGFIHSYHLWCPPTNLRSMLLPSPSPHKQRGIVVLVILHFVLLVKLLAQINFLVSRSLD